MLGAQGCRRGRGQLTTSFDSMCMRHHVLRAPISMGARLMGPRTSLKSQVLPALEADCTVAAGFACSSRVLIPPFIIRQFSELGQSRSPTCLSNFYSIRHDSVNRNVSRAALWRGNRAHQELLSRSFFERTTAKVGCNASFSTLTRQQKATGFIIESSFSSGASAYKPEHGKQDGDNSVPLLPSDFHGLSQHAQAAVLFHVTPSFGLPSVGDGYVRTLAEARLAEGPAAQPGVVLDPPDLTDSGAHSLQEADSVSAGQRGLLQLVSAACSLPHPDKAERGGEDAHFICADGLHAVGVADGVGGWVEVGVDAGLYARSLMGNSMAAIKQEPLDGDGDGVDPVRVLCRAHALTRVQGSSTACILILTGDKLQAANLGDSGFIVIRGGRTLFRSPSQTHGFNFPYQLGSDGSDPPEAAQSFALAVAAGDVLVVGTDGLFDNVYETELSSIVVHSTRAGWGPADTAQKIAALARSRALDRMRQTPFSKAAQDAGYRYQGGKLDDITVVCSYIQERRRTKS